MTAVEWLISEIKSQLIARVTELDLYSLQQQAIEMEKQQIINYFFIGYKDANDNLNIADLSIYQDAEQYYNETYKKP